MAGYEPTLGIMHHGYQGSPAFVFDLMEPRRVRADAAILAFALSETFTGADFVIRSDGVVRLVIHPPHQGVCGRYGTEDLGNV